MENEAMELLAGLILTSAIMTLAWAARLWTGQSGWVDACWSAGTGLAAIFLALAPFHDLQPRQWLCAALAGAWSFRLAGHIAVRAATATADDPRYAALQKHWGKSWKSQLLFFLQIQAVCAFGLAVGVWAAAHAPRAGLGWQDWLGVAILGGSVLGAGIADAQVRAYGRKHHGGVANIGLWRWSRHPNYFFEWLGWSAYVAIAITPGYWQGWLALIGPVMMYWLLVHVSGIPHLERHMARSRGEAWQAYKARTSAFFPLPPKG
jgi:steroid 5-alpha reductase family enzyme